MATEWLYNGDGQRGEAAEQHRDGRDVAERAVPGAVAAQGDDDRDEQQRGARRQHVQLEDAGQALVDEEQIEGQRDGADALRDGDDAGRHGEQQDEANDGKSGSLRGNGAKTRHKFAGGSLLWSRR